MVKSSNQAEIRKAFTGQARGFESARMNFSKKEYLDHAVSEISPNKTDPCPGGCLRSLCLWAGDCSIRRQCDLS